MDSCCLTAQDKGSKLWLGGGDGFISDEFEEFAKYVMEEMESGIDVYKHRRAETVVLILKSVIMKFMTQIM